MKKIIIGISAAVLLSAGAIAFANSTKAGNSADCVSCSACECPVCAGCCSK